MGYKNSRIRIDTVESVLDENKAQVIPLENTMGFTLFVDNKRFNIFVKPDGSVAIITDPGQLIITCHTSNHISIAALG